MEWLPLTTEAQVEAIRAKSDSKPQVIFKHSTRCSISSMALTRLERTFEPLEADFHFLDILSYRPISNLVAETFQVNHESPQVLVIIKGECVYEESHSGINFDEIAAQAQLQ